MTPQEKEKLINRVKNSKANFVKRLLDPNRQVITDWETPGNIATHKLSYAENDNGQATVFPMVQELYHGLYDFTNPVIGDRDWRNTLKRAENRGDTIIMTIPEAEWFTTNYKDYFPTFNKDK